MKNNKILIIGSGPTSIALTLILSQHENIHITIVESRDHIGGCWNVDFVEDKYYSEHSPKVMSHYNYFDQILRFLEIDADKCYASIYGNKINVTSKFISFFFNGLTNAEMYCFITSFVKNKMGLFDKSLTLEEWLRHNHFSKKGYKTFEMLSIAMVDIPSKILAYVFFNSMTIGSLDLKQLKDPLEWIEKYHKYINNKKNVDILMNMNVTTIRYNNHTKQVFLDINDKTLTKYKSKEFTNYNHYIFCITPLQMLKILHNSKSTYVKNNWMEYNTFMNWCELSSYTSFGFQLHFDDIQEYPENWCWSCLGDWNIIVIDISNFRNVFTKDCKIKTVWSCVIIDLNAYSKNIKKTVNDCTNKEEVYKESLFQLNKIHKRNVIPYKITSYGDLGKEQDNTGKMIWRSYDSSYTTAIKSIESTGYLIRNIHWIGCHNLNSISTLENAVTSAVEFTKKYNLNTIFIEYNYNPYTYGVTIVFICVLIFICIHIINNNM